MVKQAVSAAFNPKKSKRASKHVELLAGKSDDDTWVEYFAVSNNDKYFSSKLNNESTLVPKVRSYFMNSKGTKVWDEPPSGAANIQFASAEKRRRAEFRAQNIAKEYEMSSRAQKSALESESSSFGCYESARAASGRIGKTKSNDGPGPTSMGPEPVMMDTSSGGDRHASSTKNMGGRPSMRSTSSSIPSCGMPHRPITRSARGPTGKTVASKHVRGNVECSNPVATAASNTVRRGSGDPINFNLKSGNRKIMVQHDGPLSRKDEDALLKMVMAIHTQEKNKADKGGYNGSELPPLVLKLQPNQHVERMSRMSAFFGRSSAKKKNKDCSIQEGDFIGL